MFSLVHFIMAAEAGLQAAAMAMVAAAIINFIFALPGGSIAALNKPNYLCPVPSTESFSDFSR
jgi:hypothetical protein